MQQAISFLTNENVLDVVNAYLLAMETVPFKEQVALVQAVLSEYRPVDVARLTGIPVQRLYEYRRADWVERHPSRYTKTNVMLWDFVKILRIGNHS